MSQEVGYKLKYSPYVSRWNNPLIHPLPDPGDSSRDVYISPIVGGHDFTIEKATYITIPKKVTIAESPWMWVFPKIGGFPPKSSHFFLGFPFFEPSVLGETPLFL